MKIEDLIEEEARKFRREYVFLNDNNEERAVVEIKRDFINYLFKQYTREKIKRT